MYLIPWFQYTVIHLGPIPIRVWGLFVALGMALALWIIWRRSRRLGLNPELISNLAVWSIIGGLIGARLFHVLFYEPAFYLQQPLEVFKIWRGGLSSFGGLTGALVAFWLWARRNKIFVERWLPIADQLSFAAVYGWLVGRLGCVMIHDHPSKPSNFWLAIRWPDGTPRLDLALLEIILMIPLALWFFVGRKKKKPEGWFLFVLFIYYGVLRFVLDFWRATDLPGADARYLGLTPAQYLAILLVVLGGKFFFYLKRNVGRFA